MKKAKNLIDLRSDTVTKPCAEMVTAMMAAEVGDDQYQDDRETNLLQEEIAQRLGKESALWVPSGTMANQIALRVATNPGDDVIVSTQSHAVWHEAGAGAANASVQFTEIGSAGRFTASDFENAIKPPNHHIYPPTTMVQIENTHNRCGGGVFDFDELNAICDLAKGAGVFSYLDGARLWNAAIFGGQSVAALAAPFDAVMVSMSKGLGAPGGSVLAGNADFIQSAIRQRRMLGGAMRQTGYYAAAGRFALKNNIARLFEDHAHAGQMARLVSESQYIELDMSSVCTNIVVFKLNEWAISAFSLEAALKEHGVLVNALDNRTIRLVSHLGVDEKDCIFAANAVVRLVEEMSANTASL